jgi:hypothetical protein
VTFEHECADELDLALPTVGTVTVLAGTSQTIAIPSPAITNVDCAGGFVFAVDSSHGMLTVVDFVTLLGNQLTIAPSSLDDVGTHQLGIEICYLLLPNICEVLTITIVVPNPCLSDFIDFTSFTTQGTNLDILMSAPQLGSSDYDLATSINWPFVNNVDAAFPATAPNCGTNTFALVLKPDGLGVTPTLLDDPLSLYTPVGAPNEHLLFQPTFAHPEGDTIDYLL